MIIRWEPLGFPDWMKVHPLRLLKLLQLFEQPMIEKLPFCHHNSSSAHETLSTTNHNLRAFRFAQEFLCALNTEATVNRRHCDIDLTLAFQRGEALRFHPSFFLFFDT
jgi:hypothetical protein